MNKNILVVGGGGREHALVWKLAGDSTEPRVFCAPGNAGTAAIATNLNIGAEDIEGLVTWAQENRPELTVIGPEAPLCAGLTDRLEELGLPVFGPCRAAAELEGSKVFAKEVMLAAGVPTAAYSAFTDAQAARSALATHPLPLVIKAEGLAAGKGVYICETRQQAEEAIHDIMDEQRFGDAGARIIIEEHLSGEEASILALIDGENILMLASSQDHKRVGANDTGPNTGGMGAYSPAPIVTDDLWQVIRNDIYVKILNELRRRGITYRGVLYAGLMMTANGPKVLEFNCRFGDPETQAVLPRIDGDLLPALLACANGGLTEDMLKWKDEACVCVVMAAGGYPGDYRKGDEINGISAAEKATGATVFHAGTKAMDGKVLTAGGRVLGVTNTGADLQTAVENTYRAVEMISFKDAHFRKDIAQKGLKD